MTSDELKRQLGIDDDDVYRVHSDTGQVQKERLFGWKNTNRQLDQASGAIQERWLFGWKGTGMRIDPDSGVL